MNKRSDNRWVRVYPWFLFWSVSVVLSSCITLTDQTFFQKQAWQDHSNTNELSDYRLASGDLIQVTVRSSIPELDELYTLSAQGQQMMQQGSQGSYFSGYIVDSEGKVNLPMLGSVVLKGKTLSESTNAVEQLLKEQLNAPYVFARVQLAGVKTTILGECKSPGVHFLYLGKPTLLDALAQAGDLNTVANRKQVEVYRQTEKGIQKWTVDLTNPNSLSSPVFFVQPNDVIQIKPLPQKVYGIGQTGFGTLSAVVGLLTSSLVLYLAIIR